MVKKLEDYEYMCPEPFTNIHTGAPGIYLPCCIMDYEELFKSHEHEVCETEKHTIEDWFNGTFIKKLRKAFKKFDSFRVCNWSKSATEKIPISNGMAPKNCQKTTITKGPTSKYLHHSFCVFFTFSINII